MKILIAEDDRVSRRMLETTLQKWGHEVVVTSDGVEAWDILRQPNAPPLAILDWMMPGFDGIDVCRRSRQIELPVPIYIIMLTAKGRKEDIVTGLDAGADDYLTKPFDREELRARLQVGVRFTELQNKLAVHVNELESALAQVNRLQGILPICSYCKMIRDDRNYWQQVESYITEHSEAKFSHGICPDCYETTVKPELDNRKKLQREKMSSVQI
jgi:CheY-like chemotaxis protein